MDSDDDSLLFLEDDTSTSSNSKWRQADYRKLNNFSGKWLKEENSEEHGESFSVLKNGSLAQQVDRNSRLADHQKLDYLNEKSSQLKMGNGEGFGENSSILKNGRLAQKVDRNRRPADYQKLDDLSEKSSRMRMGNSEDSQNSSIFNNMDQEEFERPKWAKQKVAGRSRKPKIGDSYEKYSVDEIRDFILMVEERPVIWDSMHQNYFREENRTKNFDDIELACKKFMPRGRPPGSCAKNLWNELKKEYTAELTYIQRRPSGSGRENRRKFAFFEALYFLESAQKAREVNNAFVIGSSGVQVMQSRKREYFENPEEDEISNVSSKGRKNTRDSRIDKLCGFLEHGNKILESIATGFSDDSKVTDSRCMNGKICTLFEHQISTWNPVDKITAEAAVINFICSLRNPATGNYHNISLDPSFTNPLYTNYPKIPSPSSNNSNLPHPHFSNNFPTQTPSTSQDASNFFSSFDPTVDYSV